MRSWLVVRIWRFLNVVARFPGCTPDAFIWQSCNLKKAFDSGNKMHGVVWLLGDSGYIREPRLHSLFLTVSPGSAEEEYNSSILEVDVSLNVVMRC
ncbi:unnamed protein product [Larinioides sclopetarius]|uniref:DDE Tnp4 domain-containing protein n=1 Tax=Larinioides sclopetarius TaxID=280406 RepID=A0AAV2BLM0_9ARAC